MVSTYLCLAFIRLSNGWFWSHSIAVAVLNGSPDASLFAISQSAYFGKDTEVRSADFRQGRVWRIQCVSVKLNRTTSLLQLVLSCQWAYSFARSTVWPWPHMGSYCSGLLPSPCSSMSWPQRSPFLPLDDLARMWNWKGAKASGKK